MAPRIRAFWPLLLAVLVAFPLLPYAFWRLGLGAERHQHFVPLPVMLQDIVFGFAVTCAGGEYTPVQGLAIDAFSQDCISRTLKELQEEQAGVAHLL